MTGNHQQDRRWRETRGNRGDPVDDTSNDLRASGLPRSGHHHAMIEFDPI
jgi:hypothetical protein